jgi:hypothetical protein
VEHVSVEKGRWSRLALIRTLRPSCRMFRLHQHIANKGTLSVFLSLKLCTGSCSLQMLRVQALVEGTRKRSTPDWAMVSTLVGGSIRALRRAYICLE